MVTVLDGGGTPSFSGLTQVATGLRNAAGMAFDPATGDLLFEDNGIDGLADVNEPLSADELNRIAAADIGGAIEDFGFAGHYIEYRTGTEVGSGGVDPLAAFQPLPNPSTGSESEGPAEIAMAPAGFPAGLNNGVFIGFHGKFNQGGIANEENPLVFYDFATGTYFHFIGNGERIIGHLDGLLSTSDSLFVADLSSTGSLFSAADAGKGVIYQIRAIPRDGGGGEPRRRPVDHPSSAPSPSRPVPDPSDHSSVPVPDPTDGPHRPDAPVVVPQPTPAVFTGPLVRDVFRLRTGRRRTAFLITFSDDMNPALASDPANYVIIAEGRGGGRAIPITSASYDPSTRSVKLLPVGASNCPDASGSRSAPAPRPAWPTRRGGSWTATATAGRAAISRSASGDPAALELPESSLRVARVPGAGSPAGPVESPIGPGSPGRALGGNATGPESSEYGPGHP